LPPALRAFVLQKSVACIRRNVLSCCALLFQNGPKSKWTLARASGDSSQKATAIVQNRGAIQRCETKTEVDPLVGGRVEVCWSREGSFGVRNESEPEGRAAARGWHVVTHIFPILGEIRCWRHPIQNWTRMSDIEMRSHKKETSNLKKRGGEGGKKTGYNPWGLWSDPCGARLVARGKDVTSEKRHPRQLNSPERRPIWRIRMSHSSNLNSDV